MTALARVFPVICPSGEPGVGLAAACWPDQKPVRACERVTRHSYAARGFHPQTDTGSCPPTFRLEVGNGCSQISWTTSSVSTRTATRTHSRSSRSSGCRRVRGDRGREQRRLRRALRLADERAPGRRAFAIEGTGSFGAGLTRFLAGRGERVLEVGRLKRERRSGRQDRRARRCPCGPQRACQRAAVDAACRR